MALTAEVTGMSCARCPTYQVGGTPMRKIHSVHNKHLLSTRVTFCQYTVNSFSEKQNHIVVTFACSFTPIPTLSPNTSFSIEQLTLFNVTWVDAAAWSSPDCSSGKVHVTIRAPSIHCSHVPHDHVSQLWSRDSTWSKITATASRLPITPYL